MRRKIPTVLCMMALLYGLQMLASAAPIDAAASAGTRNVVLIVIDGLRWQEVFNGADTTLMNEKYGGIWATEADLRQRFWNDDIAVRRRLLMPFLWQQVGQHGQLWGNQNLGSVGQVSNPFAFSYPGYNEMSTGVADPRINSNEFGPNPNHNVFEWLNTRPGLHDRVAIFGSWHTFTDIFNTPRNGLYIEAGARPPAGSGARPRTGLMDRLYRTTTNMEDGDVADSFVQASLLEYLHHTHPRVLFVGYGETDDWAHAGRYDLVLESAHRADDFIRELWQAMQAIPQYRGKTTFIVTADHGRGSGLVEWKDHGVDQKGSENIWIALMGPDILALGERHDTVAFKQAQIASTIAAAVGEDYLKAKPEAAMPLPVIGH